jgi:multidrug efflux pump subunit AcrA (membrane-fusion protein)
VGPSPPRRPQIGLDQNSDRCRHAPITHLLSIVALFAASSAQAQSRPASDWQLFKVPDYGTRLEYPASIFSAVGQAETGVGQRFESDDGWAVLTIYVRENQTVTHLQVI